MATSGCNCQVRLAGRGGRTASPQVKRLLCTGTFFLKKKKKKKNKKVAFRKAEFKGKSFYQSVAFLRLYDSKRRWSKVSDVCQRTMYIFSLLTLSFSKTIHTILKNVLQIIGNFVNILSAIIITINERQGKAFKCFKLYFYVARRNCYVSNGNVMQVSWAASIPYRFSVSSNRYSRSCL
jgi:hypothetical protein